MSATSTNVSAGAWMNSTRPCRPRRVAARTPRSSASLSVSTPVPVVAGCAARMRSRSSPQPQPRSSTWWPGEIGSAETRALARSSETGALNVRPACASRRKSSRTPGSLRSRPQPGGLGRPELALLEPPAPVAAHLAGPVHPRFRPELEHVLGRHHPERRARRQRQLDVRPHRLIHERPGERVGVVGRGADDLVDAMVLEPVRVVLRPVEGPEQDRHAGESRARRAGRVRPA